MRHYIDGDDHKTTTNVDDYTGQDDVRQTKITVAVNINN